MPATLLGTSDQDYTDKTITDEYGRDISLLGMPPLVTKSLYDPFDYVIRLTDGSEIFYEFAMLSGNLEFLHLTGIKEVSGPISRWNTDRGVDVAVSSIVFCIDAPNGS